MAKRKLIHIGDEEEEYLKSVIAGDIPKVTPEAIESIEKKKQEPKVEAREEKLPEAVTAQTNLPKAEADIEPGAELKKDATSRSSARKKKDTQEFDALFLVKRAYGEKRQIYISKDIYNRILRYMKVIAPQISLSIHFDNILLKYLEDYEDTISELYDKSVKKPI